MQQAFEQHILNRALFLPKQKLLLAMSGGVDSTVLAYLLVAGGYDVSLAHCNFQLRGKDSLADEKFCTTFAKKHQLKLHSRQFDLPKYCKEKGVNVQLAARQLRYSWFQSLLDEFQYDFILTAHHAGDIVETVLINLIRGTGINGLKGIPEKNGKIIRPLLQFTKTDIEAFAKTNKIKHRSDLSNNENKYERNFLRNKVVPLLRELNPQLEDTFLRNAFHFQQEAGIVKEFLSNKAVEYATQTHDSLFINRNRLRHERYIESILHYVLSGYGFNGTQQKNITEIIKSGNGIGKKFSTASHILIVDRNDLVLKPLPTQAADLVIHSMNELAQLAFLKIKSLKKFSLPTEKEFIVSASRIVFPLTIRTRRTGDRFRPFGLKGSKLLSDYLKEQKLNTFDKENCSILVNGNKEIMWIMGFRSDDRYRVKGSETDLLKFCILD